ncbi:inositol monophosphatase family protein [Thiorhodococcus mannitoliphagus]|uniref:Inositol monophosphatase family protein n=1 Tax=Thiorhodococcus mannitoliphagus TaxID=329406 RepID=A0A6P1DUM8_9GAMM|nr:inositol monophosphatase family protein [Thiorhodococcus mannitoliphagus]NEX19752.1 inositol monophosphatase family protein [Thiorhodococcus mannitoliphagus]
MSIELRHLAALLRETAAEEIIPRWHQVQARSKGDGSLVTETDIAAQRRIADALARDFPEIPLLGEEMSAQEQARVLEGSSPSFWALDPLDGTSNYASGFPFFAISLALIEHGEPVLGLVLDPARDECFCATKGQGTTLNERPIRIDAHPASLPECIAVMDLKRIPRERLAGLFRPGGFRSQRNIGSVALDWCWLASGRFQLYLHGGQKLWDYAAGRLIADEAGAATRLFAAKGTQAASSSSLEPHLAIGAAHEALLEDWVGFVDLPFTEAGD